jgi:DNA-binding SARP family transcriptional activator
VGGFVSCKAQALLYFLAVSRRPHSRQTLIDLFWDKMREADAAANLRTVLSNLRRLLPDQLTITRQTVEFNRDRPFWLDVDAFQGQIQATQRGMPEQAVAALRDAVDLYRGEFLEGFYVRDASNFEGWVLGQRERLRQLALQGLHRLAIFETERGRYAEAIQHTTRLLELDPWHEEAHRQMMLLLASTGQRSAALAQFAACRQVLERELGVRPSQQTSDLYQRIADGTLGLLPGLGAVPQQPPAPIEPAEIAAPAARSAAARMTLSEPSNGLRQRAGEPLAGAARRPAGFEYELAALLSRWHDVCAGRGQAVTLSDEDGASQARLLKTFRDVCAAQPSLWLEERCLSQHRRCPLHPILGLIQQALRLRSDEPLPARFAKLPRLLEQHGLGKTEASALLPMLALPAAERDELFELYAQDQQEATLGALVSLILAIAARQPVVLLLKDVHLGDPATLRLLDRLIGVGSAAPILVVLTNYAAFRPPWGAPIQARHTCVSAA